MQGSHRHRRNASTFIGTGSRWSVEKSKAHGVDCEPVSSFIEFSSALVRYVLTRSLTASGLWRESRVRVRELSVLASVSSSGKYEEVNDTAAELLLVVLRSAT